jgi:hypothetical protein
MAFNIKDLKRLLDRLPDEALVVWRDDFEQERPLEPSWFFFGDRPGKRLIIDVPKPERPGELRLFKITIDRPKRDGRDILVHAEDEDAAQTRVEGKYKGWVIGDCIEIVGESHFTIALLEPE